MPQDKPQKPAAKRAPRRPQSKRASVGTAWDVETKTQALGLILTGNTIQDVAVQTGVPKQTLSRWWKELTEEERQAVADRRGEILTGLMYDFAFHGLKMLISGAKVATDPDYIRKWPPIQIERLHGMYADKLDRILCRSAELHALGQDQDREGQPGPLPSAASRQTIVIEYVEDNTTTEVARRPEADQGGTETL